MFTKNFILYLMLSGLLHAQGSNLKVLTYYGYSAGSGPVLENVSGQTTIAELQEKLKSTLEPRCVDPDCQDVCLHFPDKNRSLSDYPHCINQAGFHVMLPCGLKRELYYWLVVQKWEMGKRAGRWVIQRLLSCGKKKKS